MRQGSAIDYTVPADELDAGDVRLEQLAELADSLVEQVGAMRERYEELARTLEEPAPDVEPPQTVGGARPVADAFVDGDDEPAGTHVHDSARLVVMEMAMSGSTRAETRAYLREALQLDGGDPIVDEVFDRTEAAKAAPPLRKRLFTRRRD